MAGPRRSTPVLPPVSDVTAQARALIAKENPDLEQGASIEPMGWLGRYAKPGAQALTNPFTGSISINEPMNVGQTKQQMADTLLHELTHRKQILSESPLQRVGSFLKDLLPSGESYNRRPEEMAAFEAEIRRAASQGRATYTPSFETGQTIEQADIPLRRQSYLQQLKKP